MPNDQPDGAPREESLLLSALAPDVRDAVMAQAERVPLPFGKEIYLPDTPIGENYFPITGIISMVSDLEEGTVEVGTVGREGVSGLPVLLGVETMPTRAYVQVSGEAMRMSADSFRGLLVSQPSFAALMLRYAQALFDQVAQTAACNRLHALEARCARWFAMTRDRVVSDEFNLKQKIVAEMLGVHRPAVTLAAGALQKSGIIRYTRGRVTVVDAAGLEHAACECYQVSKRWNAELAQRARGHAA